MLTLRHILFQCLQKETFLGMEEITKNLPGGVYADVKLKTPGKGKSKSGKV